MTALPLYIKEAFHKTFTEGLEDRENARTTPLEWIGLLMRYRDELITCPSCGKEYAVGPRDKSGGKAVLRVARRPLRAFAGGRAAVPRGVCREGRGVRFTREGLLREDRGRFCD